MTDREYAYFLKFDEKCTDYLESSSTYSRVKTKESVVKPIDGSTFVQKDGLYYAPDLDKPYSGEAVWYWGNGQKKEEGTYKDGKEQGLYTQWHENGQEGIEGTYKDGQLNGIWNGWYSNGNKRFTSILKDNVKIGKCTYWYDNGVKKTTGNYKNKKSDYQGENNDFFKDPFFTNYTYNLSNLLVEPTEKGIGTSSHFSWVDGKSSSGTEFKQSDRFILKFYWNKNGKVLVRNGNGKVVEWYQNGQKEIEGEYKNGQPEGIFTWWYQNGQKMIEGVYKNGQPNGLFIWWSQNGQKKYQVVIIGIKESYFIKEGNWVSWYGNGQKSEEGTYQGNMKVGKWTFWYDNGQKETEGTYKEGELISEKCWDEDGNECECWFGGCR